LRERIALQLNNEEAARSLRFPDQARFHPLKYLAGLAKAVERLGGRLFSQTPVEARWRRRTAS